MILIRLDTQKIVQQLSGFWKACRGKTDFRPTLRQTGILICPKWMPGLANLNLNLLCAEVKHTPQWEVHYFQSSGAVWKQGLFIAPSGKIFGESWGGRPGLPSLIVFMVSVDVKQHWTWIRHRGRQHLELLMSTLRQWLASHTETGEDTLWRSPIHGPKPLSPPSPLQSSHGKPEAASSWLGRQSVPLAGKSRYGVKLNGGRQK